MHISKNSLEVHNNEDLTTNPLEVRTHFSEYCVSDLLIRENNIPPRI